MSYEFWLDDGCTTIFEVLLQKPFFGLFTAVNFSSFVVTHESCLILLALLYVRISRYRYYYWSILYWYVLHSVIQNLLKIVNIIFSHHLSPAPSSCKINITSPVVGKYRILQKIFTLIRFQSIWKKYYICFFIHTELDFELELKFATVSSSLSSDWYIFWSSVWDLVLPPDCSVY